MISRELTCRRQAARNASMGKTAQRRGRARRWMPAVIAAPLALGGCISVNAPDKPIVIELNINIRQEVIYRLAEDAGNTIEQNSDIF